jgi:hypothetical protein
MEVMIVCTSRRIVFVGFQAGGPVRVAGQIRDARLPGLPIFLV